MEDSLTKFEEKLVDFLIGHYNQQQLTGKLLPLSFLDLKPARESLQPATVNW